MTAVPLGSGGEFDRIRAISEGLGLAAGPLGDDTAEIPEGDGALVVSTDVSVEDVHFRRSWLTLHEIGWRATAAALSDLAAAAATPAGIVIALGVPDYAARDHLVEVMDGVGQCALSVRTRVLGGDLSRSPVWSLAITVFGHTKQRMSRVGAMPGDGLWVTGTLGGARAALLPWLANRRPALSAREAFAAPEPRIGPARWLAMHGATAMMDISDGLAGDAPHLAAASRVHLDIELDDLPVHPAVEAVARDRNESPLICSAVGGEEYELLVTLPGSWKDPTRCLAATGVLLTRIGTVSAGSGVRMTLGGVPVALTGFRHPV